MIKEQVRIDIQKLIEERQQPLKDLSIGFAEIRQAEEEARKKAEAEELALLPPKQLSVEEQIKLLTKAVAELTINLERKGE
ncbi:hypothetical protein ACQCVE_00290 [Metabacillus sp. 113a]|uniref:hypothetical protein n=1 Tax=Metabacillus sp. 113a TaxID=3404706 RepID=UPI003CF8DDE0